MQRHPAYDEPELLRFCIPLRSHGDDASIKTLRNRKLCILSIHSEFSSDNSLSSRLLSFVIPDDHLIPGVSLPAIMKAWVWSWDLCMAGKHPLKDHRGHDFVEGTKRHDRRGLLLAGPYIFAWGGCIGDWSFHSKFFYPHVHGSSHNFICSRCLASRTVESLRFDDVSPEAGSQSVTPTALSIRK